MSMPGRPSAKKQVNQFAGSGYVSDSDAESGSRDHEACGIRQVSERVPKPLFSLADSTTYRPPQPIHLQQKAWSGEPACDEEVTVW